MVTKFFSSKENKRKTIVVLSIIILALIAIYIFGEQFLSILYNTDKLKDVIEGFGILGPVVFIVVSILQVLFAPIPGQFSAFAGGFIFGPLWGIIYTMIGTTIGSFIAFSLARRFGRPFVEKVINKRILKRFDYLAENGGIFTLFLIYLLPALPDDSVNYMAGLTRINIPTLVLISFIGRFPGFLMLNFMGHGVATYNPKVAFIIFGILMISSIYIYFYQKKIEGYMIKTIKSIKSKLKADK